MTTFFWRRMRFNKLAFNHSVIKYVTAIKYLFEYKCNLSAHAFRYFIQIFNSETQSLCYKQSTASPSCFTMGMENKLYPISPTAHPSSAHNPSLHQVTLIKDARQRRRCLFRTNKCSCSNETLIHFTAANPEKATGMWGQCLMKRDCWLSGPNIPVTVDCNGQTNSGVLSRLSDWVWGKNVFFPIGHSQNDNARINTELQNLLKLILWVHY